MLRPKYLIYLLLAVVLMSSPAYATYQFFPANACTGGGDALDGIDCDGGAGPPSWEACADGDVGFVVTSGQAVCIYVMDDDAACGGDSTESPCPASVQPDDRSDAAANQCWVLVSVYGNTFTSSGTINGLIQSTEDADGNAALAAGDCDGQIIYNNTQANTYILPAAAAGLNICFYEDSAHAITIRPLAAGDDHIWYNGTDCGEDDDLVGPGTVGSFICLHAKDAADWMSLGFANTWTCE